MRGVRPRNRPSSMINTIRNARANTPRNSNGSDCAMIQFCRWIIPAIESRFLHRVPFADSMRHDELHVYREPWLYTVMARACVIRKPKRMQIYSVPAQFLRRICHFYRFFIDSDNVPTAVAPSLIKVTSLGYFIALNVDLYQFHKWNEKYSNLLPSHSRWF